VILESPEILVLHHSASPRATRTEQIRQWHKERGFSDIGYHFVIEDTGYVVRGRPTSQVGAHVRGHNNHSIGICITGDNTIEGQRWIQVQLDSILELVKALRAVFPIEQVCGHRDLAPGKTVCPGLVVEDMLWNQCLPPDWED